MPYKSREEVEKWVRLLADSSNPRDTDLLVVKVIGQRLSDLAAVREWISKIRCVGLKYRDDGVHVDYRCSYWVGVLYKTAVLITLIVIAWKL